jgi:hypothetical protein
MITAVVIATLVGFVGGFLVGKNSGKKLLAVTNSELKAACLTLENKAKAEATAAVASVDSKIKSA